MELSTHRFSELFAQLGLDSTPEGIQAFIKKRAPLPPEIKLEQAEFWSEAQSRLLKELIAQDADWAEVVDQLNAALRAE